MEHFFSDLLASFIITKMKESSNFSKTQLRILADTYG